MWSEISSPEAFAQACGLLQAVLAILMWQHRAMRRGWGLGWLSLSMATGALLNLAAPWLITPLLVPDALRQSSRWLLAVAMLAGFGSLAAMVAGLRAFCERPGWKPSTVFLLVWLTLPVMVILAGMLRISGVADWATLVLFAYGALLCMDAAKDERGVGHPLLAAVLVLHPVILIAMGFASMDVASARYFSSAPYTIIGVVLFSVALNRMRLERERAQQELHALNGALEQRVIQRTQEIAQRNEELAFSLEQLERAREELASSEQRLQHVMTASGEGIWDWNVRDGTMYNSPRLSEMMGFPLEEQHRNISVFDTLTPPEERAAIQAAIGHCLEGHGPYRLEHRMRRKDGGMLWVDDRGDVVERDANGAALRMVGSVADITPRKEAEQALRAAQERLVHAEKLAALGGLVAGVAHELNTPLGNALTTVSALHDGLRNLSNAQTSGTLRRSQLEAFLDEGLAAGELVMRNVDRAARLVESFKQVAVDQSNLRRRTFDFGLVVQDTIAMCRPSFKTKPVTIEVDIPAGMTMDSHPGPLEQVLTNLIQNAVVHGLGDLPALHLRITVQALAHDGQQGVEMVFADDGQGMTSEVVKQAFDPYFTTRFGQGGSGLGLYIVYNLVQSALGGTIALKSTPGHGVKFTLWLPTVAPQSVPSAIDDMP
ncbi:ATP-binding protein [Rhodoferax aquaticus]|nr:ATP-binding protein [Rhodoferax aquaticus]